MKKLFFNEKSLKKLVTNIGSPHLVLLDVKARCQQYLLNVKPHKQAPELPFFLAFLSNFWPKIAQKLKFRISALPDVDFTKIAKYSLFYFWFWRI